MPGPQAKAVRLLRLTRIFATELLGSLMIIPYGTQTCNKPCAVPAYTANPTELSSAMTCRGPVACLRRQTGHSFLPNAGARALQVHQSLPSRHHSSSKASVTICRDVPYGAKPRTVMDIYVPSQSPASPKADDKALQQATQNPGDTSKFHGTGAVHSAEDSKQLPVVLFCHGGVWATGVYKLILPHLLHHTI